MPLLIVMINVMFIIRLNVLNKSLSKEEQIMTKSIFEKTDFSKSQRSKKSL